MTLRGAAGFSPGESLERSSSAEARPAGASNRRLHQGGAVLPWLLLASCLLYALPASSQLSGRLAFRTYGDDDGLENLTVECLLQDRDGFLWVGTQDGLFRFDGRRFVRFGRGEGLPSSRINALHQTASGRLYAGTRTGLAVLAGERFLALGPESGLPAVSIPDRGIASGAAGEVFVGTPEGLFVSRGEPSRGFQKVPLPSAASGEILGLHLAPDGTLVFAAEGRLFRRGRIGRGVAEIGRPRGLPDGERIDQTATDGQGRLWARTLTGLWGLAPGGESRFERHDGGLPEGVASGRLALDGRGRLLVPTARGLAYEEGGAWRLIGRREGLPSDTVLSAMVDREGSLWIGLAGAGLAQQLGRGAFTAWGSAEGLSHDVVWAIERQAVPGAGSGPLWVGTEDGLDRIEFSAGALRVYREADGLAGNTVYALKAGPDGSLWAGSWPGGITRIGPEPERIRRYGAEGLSAADFKVVTLYFDRTGNLWAGSRAGVYRLDRAAMEAREDLRPVRLPGADDDRDTVYGFAEDGAGTVYAVGRYGLQRLTGPAPRRFRKADGFRSDFLSSVVPAGPGEPWTLIAGYREALGAVRVKVEGDRLRVEPIDLSSGLSFDKVLFLGRGAGGALWIGGGAGVDVFRPGRPALHFNRASGLITEDMSQNAFLAEPDGTVWLGTSRGLVRHRPGLDEGGPQPPPILLTGVEAGRRRLDPRAAGTGPALLERDQRDLHASWAAPTFLDPKRLRFRYRLAGLEERSYETASHEVRFPALPTGDYRLEVVAVSGAGLVSRPPAVFSFSVRPAWWERPWAWGLGALALALLIAAVIRLRTRALEADRRELEAAVAERSAALARVVRELEEASSTDFLTGLHNRRYLDAVLAQEIAAGHRLTAFLMDLDHFKSVNDRYGHHAGDLLLVQVARRLEEVIREEDLLVRWGGEEFLIVARSLEPEKPETSGTRETPEETEGLAVRILDAVGSRPFDLREPGGSFGDGLEVRRTCSIGWAPFPWPSDGSEALTFHQVLTLADHALYLAKRSGRDRAVGVLPLSSTSPGDPGWWRESLLEAEGRWVRLVRSQRRQRDAGMPAA